MKKILFGVIVFFLVCNISLCVFAANSNIWEQSKEWMNLGKNNYENDSQHYSMNNSSRGFEELAGVLTGLGIWIVIISGAILGIKFMVANSESRSELKQGMIAYAIGSGIILGALVIWKIVFSLLDIF